MKNTLRQMINDDVGFEDITTNALFSPGIKACAEIVARESGIIAGIEVAEIIFEDFNLKCSKGKYDGDYISKGDSILLLEGNARSILTLERTVLNLMMKMSGIATVTSKMVKKARSVNKKIKIAGTRKTTPGMQFFEKSAIKFGGGDSHRFRLDDCVLIKDNHIAIIGDISLAIKKVRQNVSFSKKIEVEVETLEDAVLAAKLDVDIIMLDNMNPEQIKEVISVLEDSNLRKNVIIEISGGITPENILDYAKTGADVISMGYITHSAASIDLSMEIKHLL